MHKVTTTESSFLDLCVLYNHWLNIMRDTKVQQKPQHIMICSKEEMVAMDASIVV